MCSFFQNLSNHAVYEWIKRIVPPVDPGELHMGPGSIYDHLYWKSEREKEARPFAARSRERKRERQLGARFPSAGERGKTWHLVNIRLWSTSTQLLPTRARGVVDYPSLPPSKLDNVLPWMLNGPVAKLSWSSGSGDSKPVLARYEFILQPSDLITDSKTE